MNQRNMKKIILMCAISAALLVACVSFSGCIFSSSDTPSVSTTPVEKKDTFVGKWDMALTLSYYDLTLEFNDEKSFVYTLTVKNGKEFNKYLVDYAEGIEYNTGDVLVETGYLRKMSNGDYDLIAKYGWIYDKYGDVVTESDLAPYESIGEMHYDKSSDKLTFEDTKFKRIY